MPDTTLTVRANAFSDDGPARFTLTLPDETIEGGLTFSRAQERIADRTGFTPQKTRDLLRKACLTGNAHIGPVICEPSDGGVLVLCAHRHLVEYVRPAEWVGSSREALYTNPAYRYICHGAL